MPIFDGVGVFPCAPYPCVCMEKATTLLPGLSLELRLSVLVEGRNNIRHRKPYVVGKDNDLVTKEKSLTFGNKKSAHPVIVSV